ncbi:hypothetical protein Hdeb2414_s0002g00062391 [Helianthus debilis subsp. tardiflorus]
MNTTSQMASSKDDSASDTANFATNRLRIYSNTKFFSNGERVRAYHSPVSTK